MGARLLPATPGDAGWLPSSLSLSGSLQLLWGGTRASQSSPLTPYPQPPSSIADLFDSTPLAESCISSLQRAPAGVFARQSENPCR